MKLFNLTKINFCCYFLTKILFVLTTLFLYIIIEKSNKKFQITIHYKFPLTFSENKMYFCPIK